MFGVNILPFFFSPYGLGPLAILQLGMNIWKYECFRPEAFKLFRWPATNLNLTIF